MSRAGTDESDAPDRLTVVTYNLLNGQARAGTELAWEHRRAAVARAIDHCAPDLLGVQECFDYQARFLAETLPGFGWVGLGREVDGTGEMAAVFYRDDLFEPLDAGHFWLSATPEEPGSRSWGSHCTRIATWVRLRVRASGRTLLFGNTHLDHGSEEARLAAARLLTERLPALAGEGPLILTGDFNAQAETSEAWRLCIDAGFRDAWLDSDQRSGPEETWTDFREPRYGVRERIDWILLRGAVEARSCKTVIYREAGGFPSDHHPVRAVLELIRSPLPEEARAGQTETAVLRRNAVRALLVTPEDEVLLMCAEDPGDGHRVWFTPGGGLEPGEGDEEGLRRELFEETGRTDLAIGPLVWTRFHAFTWAGQLIHQHERFYLVPVTRFVPGWRTNPDETELMSFREYRWWTAAEIKASPELFAPRRLAELLRSLRRDGPPSAPVDAGV